MNHFGFDMYARNGATRRFGGVTRADLIEPEAISCPFCGKATTATEGRIAEHVERLGFTRCPGAGISPDLAAQRAASLTNDYRLPSESLYE